MFKKNHLILTMIEIELSVNTRASIPIVKKDCDWKNIEVLPSREMESVTFSKLGYNFVYTYPFTLKIENVIPQPREVWSAHDARWHVRTNINT